MKQNGKQIPLILLIILPLLMVLALDISPYSQSVRSLWQKLDKAALDRDDVFWLSTADSLIKYQPWQLNLLDRIAKKHFERENFNEAINSYTFIQAKTPLSIDQSILMSQSYMAIDEREKSEEIWGRIINEPMIKPEQLKTLFRIQQNSGDWYGAYQTIDKWYQLEPNQTEVIHQLVLSQILFEPQKAMETIDNLDLLDFKTVKTELEMILESDNPTYQMVLIGNIFSRLGEWDYAVQAFRRVVELDSSYAEGWAFLGNSLINTGEDGYFALEKALQLSPSSRITRAYLASYWRNQRDFQKSIDIYHDLIEEENKEPVWQLELGNTYLQNSDLEKAAQAFQITTKLAPDNTFYWLNLAKFCGEYRYEIKTVGIPAARQALSIDEKNWEVFDVIGWLYMLEKDYTSAERFLSIAYNYHPESDIVNLHLGQLYSLQNRTSLAKYYLEKCIKYTENEEIVFLAKKFLSP